MNKPRTTVALALLITGILIAGAMPVFAQDQPADNMEILQEKIKSDKKLFVAQNMELTESEAKNFWVVYAEYQKDLDVINQRSTALIESYAADYRAQTLTDAKALKLMEELVAIQKAEADLMAAYVPKLSKVIPALKAVRYLQLENKIRAAVKFELAARIPLMP
ncbi:MAG: hypothetical protein ACOZF0_07445 [Thermodesulfobacteriota bacterium]